MSKTHPGIGRSGRAEAADTDPGPPPDVTADSAEQRRTAVNELLEMPVGRMPVRVVERASSEGMSAVQYQGEAHLPPRPRLDHATIPNAKVLLNVTQPHMAAPRPEPDEAALEQAAAAAAAGHSPQVQKSAPTVPRIDRPDTGRIPMRSRMGLVAVLGFAMAVAIGVAIKLSRTPAPVDEPKPAATLSSATAITAAPTLTQAAPTPPTPATTSTAPEPAVPSTPHVVPSAPATARSAPSAVPTHTAATATAKPPETAHSAPPTPPPTASAPAIPSNLPPGVIRINQ